MNAVVKPKHPGGRPTKYTPELIRKAEDYLENYENYGDAIPSLVGMAKVLDTVRERLHVWGNDKNKAEFRNILKRLKGLQEHALLNGGLKSTMNTTIAKLVLSKHGYSDNPQGNQGVSGITVNVNRSGVVLKSGGQTLEVQAEPENTLEHTPG